MSRPGAEEQDLDKLSKRLGTPLPEAFRVIYRFHDGQHFSPSFAFWGLFGWCVPPSSLQNTPCTASPNLMPEDKQAILRGHANAGCIQRSLFGAL